MRRLALGAAALSLVLACSPQVQEARGVLIDVRANDIVYAESVTLRDAAGQDWTFRVSPEAASNSEHPTNASHLRQHMTNAEPVIVRYRNSPDGPLAVRIIDAPHER